MVTNSRMRRWYKIISCDSSKQIHISQDGGATFIAIFGAIYSSMSSMGLLFSIFVDTQVMHEGKVFGAFKVNSCQIFGKFVRTNDSWGQKLWNARVFHNSRAYFVICWRMKQINGSNANNMVNRNSWNMEYVISSSYKNESSLTCIYRLASFAIQGVG